MAATLPCFWIYKQVGNFIYKNQHNTENPYQRWIESYRDEGLGAAVSNAICICDKDAAAITPKIRNRMTAAFIVSSHLEFDFWDAAYNLRMRKGYNRSGTSPADYTGKKFQHPGIQCGISKAMQGRTDKIRRYKTSPTPFKVCDCNITEC